MTLKTVNKELANLGTKAELVRGAGYFLFRGGEADDWIDRTVAVSTVGSMTLEQWLNEFRRLKNLNEEIVKTASQPPRPQKTRKEQHEANEQPEAPAPKAPLPARQIPGPPRAESRRKQPCDLKDKLLAELDEAYRSLAAVEKKEVIAARENRVSDLVGLWAAATKGRTRFDRALLAVRDHIAVHQC